MDDKKIKIAIFTIESDNLGNKLQNYAVQYVLENQGYNVKTIKRQLYSVKKRIKDNIRAYIKKDRFTNYLLFNKNIHWDYKYIGDNHIPDGLNNRYDFFVIGSDQIWNPTFPFSSEVDYLPFVNTKKCISYAASFGIDRIPKEYESMVCNGLKHISNISVREEAGARIIRELTGRNAEVLIDPTMMLDTSHWMKIAKKPKKIDCDKPYILTYFLGGRSERVENDLHRFANVSGMQIYNLLDYTQPDMFVSGPSEFIYLVSHAKLVMTDSFHACVFSFLFGKPFLVYAREGKENDMMSRMNTLLSKFHLERKFVDSGLKNELFESDYQEGYRQLEIERKKSINFLKKSINFK